MTTESQRLILAKSPYYERMISHFPELLNEKELSVNDKQLVNDIKTTIKIIEEIEKIEKHKVMSKIKQKGGRSYKQEHIFELGLILLKEPVYIGLSFFEYLEGVGTKKNLSKVRLSWVDKLIKYTELSGKRRSVEKKGRLLAPKFFILPHKSEFLSRMSPAQEARATLMMGIFDYLQRLLNGNSMRVRTCENKVCGKWFIPTRKDNFTCSHKCKDALWLRRKGRKIRRVYMRDFARKGLKKGRYRK